MDYTHISYNLSGGTMKQSRAPHIHYYKSDVESLPDSRGVYEFTVNITVGTSKALQSACM